MNETTTIPNKVYKELIAQLEKLNERLNNNSTPATEKWLTNEEFMKLMKISKRTVQHYRDTRIIPFSQIGSKVYYKLSDVQQFYLDHYVNKKEKKRLFTQDDLFSFGRYLLSGQRENNFSHLNLNKEDLIEHKRLIHHADYENWKPIRLDEEIEEHSQKLNGFEKAE